MSKIKITIDELDKNDPTNFIIKTLKICGIWPNDNYRKYVNIFYSILIQIIIIFTFVLATCINLASIRNLSDTSESLYMCLTLTAMEVKILVFFIYNKKIINLVKLINHRYFNLNLNQIEINTINTNYIRFNKFRRIFVTMASSVILSSFLSPPFSKQKKFPYPAWYPYDWKNDTKIYGIWYFHEVIAMTLSCYSNITLDIFMAYLLLQLGIHYEILNIKLENCGKNKNENLSEQEELIDCIKMHQKIIK